MGFKCRLWVCLCFILSLVPFSLAQANNQCSEEALQTLQDEVLGLKSIHGHFQDLAHGNLTPGFSLSSIFTIDLLDTQDVKSRIQDLILQRQQASQASPCSSQVYTATLKERNQLVRQIMDLRLSYLSLSLEERRYLDSLINIYQRYFNDQNQLQHSIQQAASNRNDLNKKLESLEQRFKTQQDPELRAALSQEITEIDKTLQQIKGQLETELGHLKSTNSKLNFTQALLIDYYQVYIKQNFDAQKALPHFSRLATAKTINNLLKSSPQSAESSHLIDLSALFIIHSRIYGHQRKHSHWQDQIPLAPDAFLSRLDHELKTIAILPFANLHLKLYNTTSHHQYLSKTFYQSAANLLTQIIIGFLMWHFIKRVPEWVHQWQRRLIQNHLTKRFSRWTIGFLRILQPNAAWLSAIGFYYYLDSLKEETLRDLIILYELSAVAAFYLLINTLATWTIGNTNSRAHLFVLRSKQLTIAHHCHRYAMYITLISVLYIILANILNGGIICTIYQFAIIAALWLFSYHLINQFQDEFQTHLSKRVSEQTLNKFVSLQRPFIKAFLNPAVFTALQFYDLIIGIHNRLLRLESYQTLTAKFLKIRLEQSQTVTEPVAKDSQDDIHYESWFFNKDLIETQSGIMLHSPWIKEINQFANTWLEGKQDENDLALIGEYGIGKTTLIKQWLKQWEGCKTAYIKIPPKTCTEEGIFKAVCKALDFDNIEDIAQFVVTQQNIEKTIVIIDEAQNLFLSDVGCFGGYKMLHSLINAKLDNIYWIIAINQQSWIYLNDVFSRTYQFSNRIHIQRWSQQEIRELILNRHRASRRKLTYDELLLASTSHSETAARAAESRCFSLLWDQSAGIPAVALAIWINSARTPAPGKIEMGIPERPSSNTLAELSDDHLFVYAALIIHQTLNTQQAQAVTHLPEAIVRRALKLGLDQGFLIRKSHGRYVINPLWHLQLSQLLRRKNFLHE